MRARTIASEVVITMTVWRRSCRKQPLSSCGCLHSWDVRMIDNFDSEKSRTSYGERKKSGELSHSCGPKSRARTSHKP